jgi:multidrug resistance efflux pump
MIRRKHIFFLIWAGVAVILILFSVKFRTSSDAIVAVVEPQRVVISFPKAVKLMRIFVVPGQRIEAGDTLCIVERPKLLIELEQIRKSLNAAHVELKNLELKYNSELNLLKMRHSARMNEINEDIQQIRSQLEFNKRRLEKLKSVSQEQIKNGSGESPAEIKLKSLETEYSHAQEFFDLSKQQLREKTEAESQLLQFKIDQMEQEMTLLEKERVGLTQVASSDGTIGNVYVQTEEIVSPYTNILSIYETNPNVIRAFLNEENKDRVEVGSKVIVESSNRRYKVDGEVIEIGSRIIDYPDRLLDFPTQELWGQEIFIRISGGSNFLNGEKVYVRVVD